MKRSDLLGVASRVVRALGPGECVLIGGLAVAAHGYVRATDDVDVLTTLPLTEARKRLAGASLPVETFRGDPIEGDFSCLKGYVGDIRFDVLPPLVLLDLGRATTLETPGGPLPVVDLEGLLRLKFRAAGVQDLLDAAVLILLRPQVRDVALQAAQARRVLDRLDAFLADPRTQATVSALREGEARRTTARRRSRRSRRP